MTSLRTGLWLKTQLYQPSLCDHSQPLYPHGPQFPVKGEHLEDVDGWMASPTQYTGA